MKKTNTRTPVVFSVGCVLLCLTLLSSNLTSGLYARYSTTASGSDSARVAKFDVRNTVSSASTNIQLNFYDPSHFTDTVLFTVTSSSEVAVRYSVTVTMPDDELNYNWLEVKLGDSESSQTADNTFTFSKVGEFTPGATGEQSHILSFTIKDSYKGKPGSLKDMRSCVTITVHAEQID